MVRLDRLLLRSRAVHLPQCPRLPRPTNLPTTLAVLAVLAAFAAPVAAQDGSSGSHRRRHGATPAAPATPDAAPAPAPSDAGSTPTAAPVEERSAQVAAPEAEAIAEAPPASSDEDLAAPESAEATDAPMLRLGVSAGLGRVHQSESNDAANYADVGLRAAYVGVQDLDVGLDGNLQLNDRSYVTTLPGNGGSDALRVPVQEMRMRFGLDGGYNVLGAAGVDRDLAGASPYLRFELDQFSNDVVPETVIGVGVGLRSFVRVADGLRLEGGVAYSYAVSAGPADVAARLAFGTVLGSLQYRGGISIALPPRARLRLSYEGEWLALEHANSYQNSLSLGLDVDL